MGVIVSVMKVRIVRMLVPHWHMTMPVRMRLGYRSVMAMPMMFVVDVTVLVVEHVVIVGMHMRLGQMHPQAECH
jgi:hypothetical protein